MTRHTYPTSAMLGDYVRAAVGLVPTLAILAIVPVGMVGTAVLGGFAALFVVFGIRTALRHGTQIEATHAAVKSTGLIRASILWSELDRLRLAYYSIRRDGRGGWMQLELRSGSSALRVDSRIEGFTELVTASAKAARIRGLSLNAATSVNLEALGIKLCAAGPGLSQAAAGAAM
jgi:hypothetical protein